MEEENIEILHKDKKKPTIFFAFIGIFLFLAIGASYVIFLKSYPVILVDWRIIPAGDYEKDLNAAMNYYNKAKEVYNAANSENSSTEIQEKEIKRIVLESLIENSIIEEAAEKNIGKSDLKSLVADKIEQAIKNNISSKEVEAVMGITLSDFKNRVLRPQAEKDILEGRLILNNSLPEGGFMEWLKNEKKKVKVIVLIPGFEWNGENMVVGK